MPARHLPSAGGAGPFRGQVRELCERHVWVLLQLTAPSLLCRVADLPCNSKWICIHHTSLVTLMGTVHDNAQQPRQCSSTCADPTALGTTAP